MIVLAHPRPGSFSHALADAAGRRLHADQHDVARHDLHREGFDPVQVPEGLDTTRAPAESALSAGADALTMRHRVELAEADTLVVVHPNWWGKPPAIMAGWMDPVLRARRRLSPRRRGGRADFTAGSAPARGPEHRRHRTGPEAEVFGDPLDSIWRRCVGLYLGCIEVRRLVAGPLAGSTAEQRSEWLEQAFRLVAGRPSAGRLA